MDRVGVKEEVVDVKVEDGEEAKYACPVCKRRFLYMFNLGRHMAAQECIQVQVKSEQTQTLTQTQTRGGSDRESAIHISDDEGTYLFVLFKTFNCKSVWRVKPINLYGFLNFRNVIV